MKERGMEQGEIYRRGKGGEGEMRWEVGGEDEGGGGMNKE